MLSLSPLERRRADGISQLQQAIRAQPHTHTSPQQKTKQKKKVPYDTIPYTVYSHLPLFPVALEMSSMTYLFNSCIPSSESEWQAVEDVM